jgi:hypothetical protein
LRPAARRLAAWKKSLGATPQLKPDQLQAARGPSSPYLSKLYRLGMLAPDIQAAILTGRQPRHLTLQQLLDSEIPVSWVDQRVRPGLPAA